MTSPMPADRRPLPPSTRMHRISFAPVLSATLSRDSCWITSTPAISRRASEPGGSVTAFSSTSSRDRDSGGGSHRRHAHLAFSRISATRQRLVADSGRVSISSTRSPTPQALVASCALYFLVRRSTLPYLGCLTWSSTWTTTVLSILSLTTSPSRPLRLPLVSGVPPVAFSLMCRPPRHPQRSRSRRQPPVPRPPAHR